MSGDIAILTPDPASDAFAMRWPDVAERLAEPLRAAGLSVDMRSWTGAGDLTGFGLVLPLTVWGYYESGERWPDQVRAWERDGVRLANPAAVLAWNGNKAYLARLAERGAPVVPTLYTERLTEADMARASERFGTDRLVAKPRVSAGAFQTIRWSPGTPHDDGPTGPAMIQPYLPDIEITGEISLIYLGGRFSHAIRKVPRSGDFRVQPEHGAQIARHDPAPDERATAEAVLATIDESLLYARVDLVRDLSGEAVLMEIELTEPDLYLQYAPAGDAAFTEAVRAQLAAFIAD